MGEREPMDHVSGKRQKRMRALSPLVISLLAIYNKPQNPSIRDLEQRLRNQRANRPPKRPIR